MTFRKEIGLVGILFASISAMVGSGWLFSSLYAAQMAGPAAVVAWLLAGAFTIIIALTFAEVGVQYPVAGGTANYPFFTHGKFAGFLLGWIAWLSFVVCAPIEVQAVIQYASNFFPSLIQFGAKNHSLSIKGYAIAAVLMLLLVYINTIGARFMANTNKFFSIWKLIIPAIAIIMFFAHANPISSVLSSSTGGFAPNGFHGILKALAVGGVIFSFNGFQVTILLAGEAKNPQKTIPRALIGSIIIGLFLYGLLQLSFIFAVPHAALIKGGWEHLNFLGDAGPLAGLAAVLGVIWVASLLYIDAVVAPMGAGIVYVASTSRILYALSANGYLPAPIKKLNKKGLPSISIWVNFIVGMLAFLPFPGWQSMVAFLSSTMVASYAVIPVCLLALRRQHPNNQRPFKLKAYKFVSFLAFYICSLMLYWTGWSTMWKLFLGITTGFILYFVTLVLKKEWVQNLRYLKCALWILLYYGGIMLISRYGGFGEGLNLLPEGSDFVIVGIFSLIALWFSQYFILSTEESLFNINQLMNLEQNKLEKKHVA